MTFARAGIPAALLALLLPLLAGPAMGQQPPPNPLDIFKNRKLTPQDTTSASRVRREAPPPTEMGLPVRALRVPGTTAFLGDSVRNVLTALGVWATAQRGEGGQLYTATVTFFGEPARARLHFMEDRLAQAEFEMDEPGDRHRRFVMDELTRQGYRRRCRTLDARLTDCTWEGRTLIWVQADVTRLTARVDVPPDRRLPPPGEPAADAGALPATAGGATEGIGVAPAALLSDTLHLDRPSRTGRPAPAIVKAATPTFPPAARRAGVQGIVHVIALVDENGAVVSTALLNSIPELDAAALETAARYHFTPLREDGRPVRFQVDIPVRFLLH